MITRVTSDILPLLLDLAIINKLWNKNMELEKIFGKFDDFEYRERRPLNKLVAGNGINDSPFIVAPTILNKRVTHPAYSVWRNMLFRCYNSDYKEKHPTYKDVICCEEWLYFTNFAKWFKNNYVSFR